MQGSVTHVTAAVERGGCLGLRLGLTGCWDGPVGKGFAEGLAERERAVLYCEDLCFCQVAGDARMDPDREKKKRSAAPLSVVIRCRVKLREKE